MKSVLIAILLIIVTLNLYAQDSVVVKKDTSLGSEGSC